MTDSMRFWRCGECSRYFASETEIMDHYSRWSRIHAACQELPEHDGAPWTVMTMTPGSQCPWWPSARGSVKFVMPWTEGEPGDFVYIGWDGQERIGNVSDMAIPDMTPDLAVAMAMASSIGIEHDELSVSWYSKRLAEKWASYADRLAEERFNVLAMIGIAQITTAIDKGWTKKP